MTEEETEKTVQFIVEQQAQFSADIEKLTKGQSQLADATLANTGMIGRLVDMLDKITDLQGRSDNKVIETAEAQVKSDGKVAEMGQALAELTERLDTFIITIERYM